MASRTFDRETLLDLTVNMIPLGIMLFFIGVLPFSDPNWGVTMNLAYQFGAHYRPQAMHWLIVPIVAIVGLSMGMILLSQSLDRVFNPRVRAKHARTVEETGEDGSDEAESTASSWV